MGIKKKIQVLNNHHRHSNNIKKLAFSKSMMTSVILLFVPLINHSQNQVKVDSVTIILNTKYVSGLDLLSSLHIISSNTTDPDNKIEAALRLIEEAKKQNNYVYIIKGLISIGYSYKLKGELEKSLATFLKAAKLASENNDPITEGDIYTNIAQLYTSNEDHQKSLVFYERALKLYKKKADTVRLAGIYVNYGYSTYKAKLYDSAISLSNKAVYFSEKSTNNILKAYAKANMALALAKSGKSFEADQQLNEAMRIMEVNKDYYGLSDCLIEIGGVYLEEKDANLAILRLEKGYHIALEYGLKDQIKNGANFLSKAYQQKGELAKALEYQTRYYAYRDSLASADQVRKLAELRTNYEVGQKQVEVDLLTTEKRVQQIIIFSTVGGALLVAILLGLVYKNYRNKNRINKILEVQKTQLEDLNSTKDRFFSIISHDIRGPVQAFSGISGLINYAVEAKDYKELVDIAKHVDITSKVLSQLLDGLLTWALQQQGHFPHVPEKLNLEKMGKEINGIFSNSARAKKIEITTSIPANLELWVDKNTSMTILRNLLNNALKFTSVGGQVRILAEADGAMAKITVEDTGIGISSEKLSTLFKMDGYKTSYGTSGERGLGLGLQLVYEFLELNNGTVKVESEEGKGTSFIVHLPLYGVANDQVEVL